MFSSVVSVIVYSSIIGAADGDLLDGNNQAIAHHERPVLLMIGTEWCSSCHRMKTNVMPIVKKSNRFKEIVYIELDYDKRPALARKITKGGPVPQLIFFYKTSSGWKRKKLEGCQDIHAIIEFLEPAVHEDNATIKKYKISTVSYQIMKELIH